MSAAGSHPRTTKRWLPFGDADDQDSIGEQRHDTGALLHDAPSVVDAEEIEGDRRRSRRWNRPLFSEVQRVGPRIVAGLPIDVASVDAVVASPVRPRAGESELRSL